MSSKLRISICRSQLEEAVPQIKIPGQDSEVKQAAEAQRRENEKIEAENRKKDQEVPETNKQTTRARHLVMKEHISNSSDCS